MVRSRYNIPAIAVAEKGSGHFQIVAKGVRKWNTQVPVQVTDEWDLSSNTKAITSTLVAILVERGLLNWTTTIGEGLPDLAASYPAKVRNVAIYQLTSHRSGLDSEPYLNNSFLQSLYDPKLSPVDGRNRIVQVVLSKPQNRTVGLYKYDNINYQIVGSIIDRLGSTFEDTLIKYLLTPLKLTNCGFGSPPQSSITAIDNPWAHRVNRTGTDPVPWDGPLNERDNPPAFNPSGGLYCDAFSYARWLQLHIDAAQGIHDAGKLLNLSLSAFQFLHTPHPGNGTRYTYGGWELYNSTADRARFGGWILAHSGANAGSGADAIVAPWFRRNGTSAVVRAAAGRLGAAWIAFSNVGDALDGKSAYGTVAQQSVIAAVVNGTLVL